MRLARILSAAILVLVVFFVLSPARAEVVAIKAKRIYTATQGTISDGVILIENGKFKEVGKQGSVAIPTGARVVDASAKYVLPGFVDVHTHIGVASYPNTRTTSDVNELTDPITPQVRAIDAFNPNDPALKEAVAGGVTTVVARPGSGNVIGGQSIAVKLKGVPQGGIERMLVKSPADMKMALEWNPILVYGARNQAPETRMEVYALARKALVEAREYQEKWQRYEKEKAEGKDSKPPERDLKLEALGMILRREIPVHIHTSRADEVMLAVRLGEEFGLDYNIGHGEWGYLVADELAKRNIIVVVGPRMFRRDPIDGEYKNTAGILAAAGVRVAIQSDHPVTKEDYLIYNAALAVRYGMKEEDAVKALTIHPAQAMHLESRIGSIEPGKDADLVIMDGEPFEVLTHVDSVWIDGEEVYHRQ